MLTNRQLNRATLCRQGLLCRRHEVVAVAVFRLVGLQAQNPLDPYYALHARIAGFRPQMLATLVADREVVRLQLMRSTIHLVTADDALALRPVLQDVLERTLRSTQYAKDVAAIDRDSLLDRGRQLLAEAPRTRAELGPMLASQWPGVPGPSLAQAVTYQLPVVQVPPRGVWGSSAAAAWALLEGFVAGQLSGDTSPDALLLRYLGAFGPASAADARTWSGLTGVREILDRLRPTLRTFRSQAGAELFDLPDAPRPDPDTPAPPRLLPEYDNVLLAHADRSRMIRQPAEVDGWAGHLLSDGLHSGTWKITRTRTGVDVALRPTPDLADDDIQALIDAARAMLEDLHPQLDQTIRVQPT